MAGHYNRAVLDRRIKKTVDRWLTDSNEALVACLLSVPAVILVQKFNQNMQYQDINALMCAITAFALPSML